MNDYYNNLPPVLADEEIKQAARDGDYNRIVEHNLRLVVNIASGYVGLPLDDLVQEGNVGLVEAAQTFDPDRGTRFSTYATPIITQRIVQALRRETPITCSDHASKQGKKIREATILLQQRLRREPTIEELAKETGVSETVIRNTRIKIQNINDYDAADNITDHADPTEKAETSVLADQMYDHLYLLTEQEKQVLYARYGMLTGEQETYDHIAEMMGITRRWVRELESRALRKLRKAML